MTRPADIGEFREQLRSRKHTLHQLRMKLQSLCANERFGALLGIFSTSKDGDSYTDQEVAGKLLIDVMPECIEPLEQILDAIAPTWNVSVEQLPLYLATTFGGDAVIDTARSLLQKWSPDDQRTKALDTIIWWLENRRAERRAEMRTNIYMA